MAEHSQQLLNQLALARTEIKNLRQQLSALKHEHLKEIKNVQDMLEGLRCTSCGEKATTLVAQQNAAACAASRRNEEAIPFQPIGVIRSTFYSKRAVPRQATILANSKGAVEIDRKVLNNPQHALDGLEDFSHMWIMFHFHMNESSGVQAKVSPPQLAGERRGVLSTRSPHRPCPIGLSLVKITKIEGNRIYFLGVDMVDGTPVLDVKPYIPQYDDPRHAGDPSEVPNENHSPVDPTANDRIGSLSHTPAQVTPAENNTTANATCSEASPNTPKSPHSPEKYSGERGAPDGQEYYTASTNQVRVANWINQPHSKVYEVSFTTYANNKIQKLIGDRAEAFKTNIQSLLSEDPRSSYIRGKFPNTEYNCVLEDLSVTCVFNADIAMCTIISVRGPDELYEVV